MSAELSEAFSNAVVFLNVAIYLSIAISVISFIASMFHRIKLKKEQGEALIKARISSDAEQELASLWKE